ncbi:cache domain-containing sensor histidine kinase [Cohnella cholangitidis]|uniref:histidine kinase n=1 Tax=Cohnella cholangitidis TaxID=2598458 RepID=A0A7G5BVG0_9BACL|nr:sensor histidine kinase [Cohnella cholangitidis]QMV40944.1 sensor histidine kinase [Cohnella cholangitidis]
MSGWQRVWRSVFAKFSAAFIVVGLIPLFALSLFSLRTFTDHVERNTNNNLEQMVLFMGYNLDNLFSDYDKVSKLMYYGSTNLETQGASSNRTISVNVEERINEMSINDFLTTVLYSDTFIRNAYFVRSMDNKLYSQTKDNKSFLPEALPLADWTIPLKEQPKQLAVFPVHEETYYKNSKIRVMTVGRNLIDTSGLITATPKIVGTLYFDVDVAVFENLFRELRLGDKDELFVLDADNSVYYSNKEIKKDKVFLPETSDRKSLVLSEEVPFLKGQVVVRVSKGDLYEQLTSIRSTVYMAIVICALALVVMGIWFSRRLSSPIMSVIKQMIRVESGNLESGLVVKTQDEIGRLAHGFNRMVERLKSFINDAYVAEIKQKQAELNALKSQIRPHYLYNTLEVIRMNAVHNDDNEVADMILSLSNQLKYVIDYGEEWVTIRRELEHLKDYFYIIKVRFESRIELRCDVADHVDLDWSMLKLSLQPIVENAIQHGIRPKGGKGTVWVTIETVEDMLGITVYDDGVGIDSDTLERLHAMLQDPKAPSKNVGMKNVHERIRAVCGEPYGLNVSSREHVGTSVRLLIPIRKGEEEHDDSGHSGG